MNKLEPTVNSVYSGPTQGVGEQVCMINPLQYSNIPQSWMPFSADHQGSSTRSPGHMPSLGPYFQTVHQKSSSSLFQLKHCIQNCALQAHLMLYPIFTSFPSHFMPEIQSHTDWAYLYVGRSENSLGKYHTASNVGCQGK